MPPFLFFQHRFQLFLLERVQQKSAENSITSSKVYTGEICVFWGLCFPMGNKRKHGPFADRRQS